MNRLTTEKRAQVIGSLVEGNSIRATVRMTGAAKNTVTKLLVDLGAACAEYQDRVMVDLPCKTLQADEIWAFCYSKQKNVPQEHRGTFGYGDVWTWTAICADTKLVPSWLVGERNLSDAFVFMTDLADRLANRVQLTTDGHRPYLTAVEGAFGHEIDYAMLQKMYGPADGNTHQERKYSPNVCTGIDVRVIEGDPDPSEISTSYVERQNLTMRMGMRRYTRLTNAFSKKVENLAHAVSLHYMHYNFARPHQSLALEKPQRSPCPADACDGRWHRRSRLDAARDRRAARFKLTHYRRPSFASAYWASDEPVDDAVDLAATLADAFSRTGVWPLLWRFDDDPAEYMTEPGDPEAIGAIDVAALLRAGWEAFAGRNPRGAVPLGSRLPSLAAAPSRSSPADNPFTRLPRGERRAHLLLVPSNRPADAVAVIGGLACETGGPEISAVMRSWEERFSAVPVGR